VTIAVPSLLYVVTYPMRAGQYESRQYTARITARAGVAHETSYESPPKVGIGLIVLTMSCAGAGIIQAIQELPVGGPRSSRKSNSNEQTQPPSTTAAAGSLEAPDVAASRLRSRGTTSSGSRAAKAEVWMPEFQARDGGTK
jgi:hypothetical protein